MTQKPNTKLQNTDPTLKIYFYYRFALSLLLYIMYESQFADSTIGKSNPILFEWTSLSYIVFCFVSFFIFPASRLANSSKQITFILCADLIALTLLIHASSGIASGLGYLLLVSAATASIFVNAQLALAFAALITFFVFGETFSSNKDSTNLSRDLFSAGILCTFIFLTSITFSYLTNRIRLSSEAIEKEKKHSENLQQLAQHIVERMRTGIAVLDENNTVELINESALQMLDLPPNENYVGKNLSDISNFGNKLKQTESVDSNSKIQETKPGHEVRIGMGNLEAGGVKRSILYLEDYRLIVQHAQQLKLASLGRLTASIAHEIRNPLGSISHAAQLLNESELIDKSDQRFLEIIIQNCHRVNQIIENTSVLSRRKDPSPELLELSLWLPEFIQEYLTDKSSKIRLKLEKRMVQAKIDPSNLRQVLTNLFDNGLRYSKIATQKETLLVKVGTDGNDGTSYIEVIDDGPGVPEENRDSIFEPFYTTDKQGSGLGLYISKELCEINQASLTYFITDQQKSCFKINFSHHQRMI